MKTASKIDLSGNFAAEPKKDLPRKIFVTEPAGVSFLNLELFP